MPRRSDIHKILIIGSGPIIISQACEFDYSGTQACKVLREDGFEVVLINSNPATIMTDPEMAARTYIEPVSPEMVEKVIRKEKPDALLPTLGGQTALNVASVLAERGILDAHGVTMIGASYEAIHKAEDRELFKKAMERIGQDLPRSGFARDMEEARRIAKEIGYPLIIRPSFTLGGTGGGVVFNVEEFEEIAARGIESSMIHEILIEESVLGWKEYELEVMRDAKDNVVIVCAIENFDPMGVHTGDSITVAPAQTLTDREYQEMRDASLKIIREIGVETGGSNIQFAVNPRDGRRVVIEMNPRVSRSSALASKATGFPIAKMAAKLAVGYTLDEIQNDITRETPASFEPAIDYCVVKIPRFTFEKFPGTDSALTISMKSVGETMAIGRTFKEALQKGVRSLETGRYGLGADGKDPLFAIAGTEGGDGGGADETLKASLRLKLLTPRPERLFYLKYALQAGMGVEEAAELSKIDPWFLQNIKEIVEVEGEITACVQSRKPGCSRGGEHRLPPSIGEFPVTPELLARAKRYGFSDIQLGYLAGVGEDSVRTARKEYGIRAVFKLVDTCAGEFEAYTPYYYSTYEEEDESRRTEQKKIMILGGGPNRIGQGIEFDYCCVHASFALKELGYETIMVNSNPETVSTDYDTSSKLYFEPLTLEDVLAIVEKEKPDGVIVQFGGQTPLNLAVPLARAQVPIIGTTPDNIDRAESRDRFKELLRKLNLNQPLNDTAGTFEEAKIKARKIGFPVVVRPSYVLGGRAMSIVYHEESLEELAAHAIQASPQHPLLIDKFLEDAIEIDVDAVADGDECIIAGIMEHIEEAGIHSGDSACVIPPYTLGDELIAAIKESTRLLARELQVVGLMNIQFAVKNDLLYVLEVNPRASRTVPFVSKATGIAWAKIAARVMVGEKLSSLGIETEHDIGHVAVKEAVFPFNRFPGVDPVLGPEMKSTGEVMGIDSDFGRAYVKSQIAAGQLLPVQGRVLVSVRNRDKRSIIFIAKKLVDLGFSLLATSGTARVLATNGLAVKPVLKITEGRPNIADMIKNGDIALIINTPSGREAYRDKLSLRSLAVLYGVPYITTISGASAAVHGIEVLQEGDLEVKALQDYHKQRGA